MKKVILLILSICILCTTTLPVGAASEEQALETVRALGILNGDANGNLNLGKPVTRAEFVKMMTSASICKDTVSSSGSGFSLFKDVKSGFWGSEYIRLAIDSGWVVGYTDRTFRPNKTITLEEASSALLKMLGYDSASLAGSFPQAQLAKADALGLYDNLYVTKGDTLTRADCVTLFYNLLTAKTKDNKIYASTLGYALSGGEVDYTSVVLENMSGPFVADSGEVLPFNAATVYRDGKKISSDGLAQYDVYYYNESIKTVWIYTDRVSGKISKVLPSQTAPTSVVVSGNTYDIGSSLATYKLSSLAGGTSNDMVILLLGMDNKIVDVINDAKANMSYIGVVKELDKTVSEDQAMVETIVRIMCTDGIERSFTVSKDAEYKTGSLVSVNISNGSTAIRALGKKTISGKVNSSATMIGNVKFAENIQILDTSSEGDSVKIEPTRIAGRTVADSDVRYYAVNSNNEITHLILNDVTGDTWIYAYMISVDDSRGNKDNAATETFTMSYTYIQNGDIKTVRTNGNKHRVGTGGVAIRYNSDGTIKSMKNISSAKITDVSLTSVNADNKTYTIADNVQVYLKQNDSYYNTNISDINAENYTLQGYYDEFNSHIRLIIAVAK